MPLHTSVLLAIGLLFAAHPAWGGGPPQRAEPGISALLARRCLECHQGEEAKGGLDLSRSATAVKGGESGPALTPGKPDESLLWHRIANDEMPPKKPLPAAERELIRSWLASGAKWDADPIDPLRYTTDRRAGYDWWALQSLKRPPAPPVKNGAWVRNAIDAFVLARLESQKLAPSPPADARTLLRRLAFDITGLPPARDDLTSHSSAAASSSDLIQPAAWSAAVDRSLASPRYGERWARHWLDVARFGESQGFERDKLRTNAWRFRDWVVQALNSDLPYDEFARLQIAGDVLRPGEAESLIATGFLVAGPYDEVGQQQQSAAMKAVVRQDELEELVGTVCQSFLGLTANCARCHDHKFDPILQVEYYRLSAALAGARHGERELPQDYVQAAGSRVQLAAQERNDQLAQQIHALENPIRTKILARRSTEVSKPPPEPMARWEFDDTRDGVGSLHLQEKAGPVLLEQGKLKLDGKTAWALTAPLPRDLGAKTLEAWVRLENLTQRGGGVIGVETLDGSVFDALVFAEREPARWIAGSDHFRRTQNFEGPEEKTADQQMIHIALVYHADGTIAAFCNGQPYGKPYHATGPVLFKAGQSQVIFGLRHSPAGSNKHLAGAIDKAQLYDRALTAEEVARSAGVLSREVAEEELLSQLSVDERRRRAAWLFEFKQLSTQQQRLKDRKCYAAVSTQPPDIHLLRRGNPAEPGELVTPGGIASLGIAGADFALAADASDAERRSRLAGWICSPHNPLFARVMVNRLWHYHFGVGLVDTPNDFGFNGGRPSHPQLLDWLACELVENGFSLKHVHRLILNSATYQQGSRAHAEGLKIDAENRLLWRHSPRRLEAEVVRDSMLQTAGELVLLADGQGGPGYEEFVTYVRNSQFYQMLDPSGPTFHRRSLYRTWVRSGRNRLLDVFDCPDPSAKAPARAVTITPLQTLSLLNNPFVLRMADCFSQRLLREAGDDGAAQVRQAYKTAYSRPPDDQELQLNQAFVQEHGLAALCRVIFNSNEFLYVD